MPVRAILFDKDGTLVDFDAAWGTAGHAVMSRLSDGDMAAFSRLVAVSDYDLSSRRFRPTSAARLARSLSILNLLDRDVRRWTDTMTDRVAPAVRSRIMAAVGTKDTAPEMTVRRALHRLGYRYRLHRKDLPGKPDIVFPARRAVVFVHGCFWHGHGCRLGRLPASKLDYWEPKIVANRLRDKAKIRELRRKGWRAIEVWQCELRSPDAVVARLRAFLESG